MISDPLSQIVRSAPGLSSDLDTLAVARLVGAPDLLRLARRAVKRRIRRWWRLERELLLEVGYPDLGEAGA